MSTNPRLRRPYIIFPGLLPAERQQIALIYLGWRLLDVKSDGPAAATTEFTESLPGENEEYGGRIEAVLAAASFAGLSDMSLCHHARRQAAAVARNDWLRESSFMHAVRLMKEKRVASHFPPGLDYLEHVCTGMEPYVTALRSLLVAAQFRGCHPDILLIQALDHQVELRGRIQFVNPNCWWGGNG